MATGVDRRPNLGQIAKNPDLFMRRSSWGWQDCVCSACLEAATWMRHSGSCGTLRAISSRITRRGIGRCAGGPGPAKMQTRILLRVSFGGGKGGGGTRGRSVLQAMDRLNGSGDRPLIAHHLPQSHAPRHGPPRPRPGHIRKNNRY